jgi:hypothetical protein
MWVLVIGLAWLGFTAGACLLIARAIRLADAREEAHVLLASSARRSTVTAGSDPFPKLSERRVIVRPIDEPAPDRRAAERPEDPAS